MRIAILGHGSRGDIQPMIALGLELSRQGHSVVLTVNCNLVAWAQRSGLEIVALPLDSEAYLKSELGQRMLAAGDFLQVFKHLSALEREANLGLIGAFTQAATGAELILSTGLTLVRGVILAEKFAVPHRVLCLQPITPTIAFPYFLVPVRDLGFGVLNRLSYGVVFERMWPAFVEAANSMRTALDLTPWAKRPKFEQTLGSINLFSEHLVPHPKDWGTRHPQPGFVRLQPEDRVKLGEAQLSTDLHQWLDAGEPPVYFGFGSMPILDPAAMTRDIGQICDRLGLRALIGAGWSRYDAPVADQSLFIAPHFDHDQVLPRCRAAVHHGGAGTTHAALAAGLPSLVCPLFSDQPYWARRVTELGVGVALPFRKLHRAALERRLLTLFNPAVRERAAALGSKLAREDGTARASEAVAALVPNSARP